MENQIIVSYIKPLNGDFPAISCMEDNGLISGVKILVAYQSDDANELYKLVSEQGYLENYKQTIREASIQEVYKTVTDFLIENETDLDFNLKLQNRILDLIYTRKDD